LSAVLFIVCGAAAQQNINPDGDAAGRLIATFLPLSSKADDYVGRGWQYRIVQWLCMPCFLVAIFVWGLSGSAL
jgi:hypothetical protein